MTVALIILTVIAVWLFSTATCVRLVNLYGEMPKYDIAPNVITGLVLGPLWLAIVAIWAACKHFNRRKRDEHPAITRVRAYMFPEKNQ